MSLNKWALNYLFLTSWLLLGGFLASKRFIPFCTCVKFLFFRCERKSLIVCDAVWRRVTSCDVVWHHLTPCDVVWSHVTSCEVMWRRVKSCDLVWRHVRPRDVRCSGDTTENWKNNSRVNQKRSLHPHFQKPIFTRMFFYSYAAELKSLIIPAQLCILPLLIVSTDCCCGCNLHV